MNRLRDRLRYVALVGFGWLALAYLALPLIVIIAVSFTTTEFLRFPPTGFTLKWYARFLADPSYLEAIWMAFKLAVVSTLIALGLGVPAALVITRTNFSGQRVIGSLFLSPLILPGIIIGVAILQFASMLGFARTFVALLVGHVVIVIPYVMRTTIASLAGFNRSLEEAALDLGASNVQAFFLITLPLIKPGIIAGALFALIISWINVEVSIFNSTAELLPIPVKLFNYIQYSVDPMIAAVSAATIYLAIAAVVVLDLTVGIDRAAMSGR